MANSFKPCNVHGCNRNADRGANGKNGYCCSHAQKLAKYGDPTFGGSKTPNGELLRYIKQTALKHAGDECLSWPYGTNGVGYGVISFVGKRMSATRLVCTLAHGEPPTPDHDAAHQCGNGHLGCVNPSHLAWKTKTENAADKKIHGTVNIGERNGSSKLTAQQVTDIMLLKGCKPKSEIAKSFGVSRTTIEFIHSGKKWGWLTMSLRPSS